MKESYIFPENSKRWIIIQKELRISNNIYLYSPEPIEVALSGGPFFTNKEGEDIYETEEFLEDDEFLETRCVGFSDLFVSKAACLRACEDEKSSVKEQMLRLIDSWPGEKE